MNTLRNRTSRYLGLFLSCAALLLLGTLVTVRVVLRLQTADQTDYLGYVSFDIARSTNKLVFTASGRGGLDLYLLDLQSWKVTRLTDTPETEMYPSFTANGQAILYSESKPHQDTSHIMSYSLASGKTRQLTPTAMEHSDGASSSSRDGKRITFARASLLRPYSFGGTKWDEWDIYTMKPDGSDVQRVTSNQFYSLSAPIYAMQDKVILFHAITRGSQPTKPTLYSVPADGSSAPTILDNASCTCPSLAPDGKHIAIISDRKEDYAYDILVMQPDGKNVRSLSVTRSSQYNAHPIFTGDNRRIFFLGDPDVDNRPRYRLYSVTLDDNNTVSEEATHALFENPLHWRHESQK